MKSRIRIFQHADGDIQFVDAPHGREYICIDKYEKLEAENALLKKDLETACWYVSAHDGEVDGLELTTIAPSERA